MEEYRLRVFEYCVLKKICGTKEYEVTVTWGMQNEEDFRYVYCSVNVTGVRKSRVEDQWGI
jgi:hypothetical protein